VNAPEPELAVVFSPREWADRLVRYITDHGGGRVRLRVVEGRVALEEAFDILLAEDITSFLSPRFVRELKERGRMVIGVYDPDEPTGKQRLVDVGADDVVECGVPPEEFVRRITALVSLRLRAEPSAEPGTRLGHILINGARHAPEADPAAARVIAVGGPPGGCGATEIAIELARQARGRGSTVVLVDADERAPSVAQRLGLPLTPNIRTAAEILFHGAGQLTEVVTPVPAAGFDALPGLGHPNDWHQLRPAEAVEVVKDLARAADQVIVNVGPHLEDLTEVGGPDRFGVARAVVRMAGTVVAVASPTPVGITRLLDWLADLKHTAPRRAAHIIVNKAPEGAFAQSEIAGEIRRTFVPATLHFVPFDPKVEAAAWRGDLVKAGPFVKAVGHAARPLLADPISSRSATAAGVLRKARAT
jgi:MinD-like ATPase involved in chromosome partitioning or flagellar assembly